MKSKWEVNYFELTNAADCEGMRAITRRSAAGRTVVVVCVPKQRVAKDAVISRVSGVSRIEIERRLCFWS